MTTSMKQNDAKRARHRFARLAVLAALAATALVIASPARAAIGPLYDVRTAWSPTNLPPGGDGLFKLTVRNVGDETGEADLLITDQLPAGVTVQSIYMRSGGEDFAPWFCSGVGTGTVECAIPGEFLPSFIQARGVAKASEGGPALDPTGYMGPQVEAEVEVDPGAAGVGTNLATVSGGGAAQPAGDEDEITFSATPAGWGFLPGSFAADLFSAAYPFGAPSRLAGDHPFEQRVEFEFNRVTFREGTRGFDMPVAAVKTVEVTLPRGVVGNPEATPKCDQLDFAAGGPIGNVTGCPSNTQVGYLNVLTSEVVFQFGWLSRIPIYNLEPPKGVPADFGFSAVSVVKAHIYPILDPAQNYAIKTVTPHISSLTPVNGSEVTFWGVPGDPAHDFFRVYPEEQENGDVAGAPFAGAAIRPLIANPMDCGFDNGGARIRVESYADPGNFTPVQEHPDPLNVEACGDLRIRFEPEVALQPTDRHAGAPTGLDVHLQVPQRNDEVKDAEDLYATERDGTLKKDGPVQAISTPPIKKAVVTLPEGMTINPSAAQGLGSCSPDQIRLGTNEPVSCPDNSQYGTLTLHTPILPIDEQPEGWIYIAKQGDNPFHNFLSLYLVIQEPDKGILVKVPGRLDLDPVSGQIVTSFDDLPQFPVSDMQMTFKGGVRAGLVNPTTCGEKTITAEFFSWHDPQTPHVVKDRYEITQRPDGSPCVKALADRPFKPTLSAGTLSNAAGAYSPFVFRMTRSDDDQEFSQLGVTLPPGLAAKFAGVGICPEQGIAQALSRETVEGAGALEQASPSCPASSLIGTTQVGTGVGVPLTYVPGKVYLGGPYQGAPISLVVISPAIVGPYDLGVIAVRTALNVNPTTAQGEATSDPFPQIFQGIPVRIRDIRLKLDRPDFTLNPTSCAEKQIAAHITGTGGNLASTADDTAADLTNRYQAADCASLGFKPKLSFRLFGGTKRGSHPKLRAVVRARPGDANIAAASVALPRSEFLDQSHIRTVCTRVQFAARACPPGSVYGHAVAKTPLFDQPLKGPVYLRSSSHKLPDLVAALRGPDAQPVEVHLVGRIDSVRGGIRNSFEVVPDAPVTKFTLTMQGGKKGLLVNSTDLCAQTNRAVAKFSGQNGKAVTLRPKLQNSCKRARGKKKQRRGRNTG